MIQVKVVESILSGFTWSIMNLKENSRKVDTRKRSETSKVHVQKQDNLESNDEIDIEDLVCNSKEISASLLSCQENDLVCINSSFQDLNKLCLGMTESHFLEDLQLDSIRNHSKYKNQNIKKRKGPLKVLTSEENAYETSLSNLQISQQTINHYKSPINESRSANVVSLIIDRLKKDFQRPDNFVPRIRAHTNWKPTFATSGFNKTKQLDEEGTKLFQKRISSGGPEEPRIYSIGLKYKSKTEQYEEKRRRSLIKKTLTFKNLSWLQSFDKKQIFQIESLQSLSFNKSCFFANEQKYHSQPSFQKNQSVTKNVRKSRKRHWHQRQRKIHDIVSLDNCARGKEKSRKASWKTFATKSVDRKGSNFNVKKETTSSDEEEWKNSRRKHRSGREERNTANLVTTEKLDTIPIKISDQESIILSEDTLSDKLNQDFSRKEECLKTDRISVEVSPTFCNTELRKLDLLKTYKDTTDTSNPRGDNERKILENIKTRIDDDIDKSFCVRKSSQDLLPNKLLKNPLPAQKSTNYKLKSLNYKLKSLDFSCLDNLNDSTNKKVENLPLSSKSLRLKKLPIKSTMTFFPHSKKSLRPSEKRSLRNIVPCRINADISLDNSDFEHSSVELRKLNLFATRRSSKRNLIESVDSGVLTDFSLNDHRTDETSFRSTNDSLRIEENPGSLDESKLRTRFPFFDSDSESSWSDNDVLFRKLEKAVRRFTEELILCERRIKARIKSKNMSQEETEEITTDSRRRKQFRKTRSRSSFASSPDFSKTSSKDLLSSEEDFILNISTPSLSSFTDSEYEKSS